MLSTLINAWKIPDVRKKIIFTAWMFLIFRIGAHIPVPCIDREVLDSLMAGGSNLFGFVDIISGGSFKKFTVFAMGIMPYINASIIMQLLTMVIPSWEKMAKEGQEGRKKLAQYTRYGAIVLGLIQALGMTFYMRGAMDPAGILSFVTIALTLTAGTALLMWVSELITEKGIGNGSSLIIFCGIISRVPSGLKTIFVGIQGGTTNILTVLLFILIAVAIIAAIVFIQEGERKIPVQYAQKVVGRRIYGGQSTHIPMKVNQAGVIPIIFAMSILMFPGIVASFFKNSAFAQAVSTVFSPGHIVYILLYALLILVFTYFYTATTFNPADVADNMKKYGGFIPGLRPGRPTAEYLDKVLSRLTLAGAIFLTFVALLPNLAMAITKMNIYFGGTSLLIVVGVALETMKQLETQILMRHYKGFMK